MRIACIYWWTPSVGGIATVLNALRTAAMRVGDHFDILHSRNWSKKQPKVFKERVWTSSTDSWIWVDGEIPQTEAAARWLEANYDVVVYSSPCPHKWQRYTEPYFLPLYGHTLPKVSFVMDGYWKKYEEWAACLLPRLRAVLCPLGSYAAPIKASGYDKVVISPFPFLPATGKVEPKSSTPLLVWPHQLKQIKGIDQFLSIIPDLPESVEVEIYSSGIRYFELRTGDPRWVNAVGEDRWSPQHSGKGRAVYIGNVDRPEILKALQRAWFTVNLQGMTARKKSPYKQGSYNNAEVEALYYGAVPILHETCLQTALPRECYETVVCERDIPLLVKGLIRDGTTFSQKRIDWAREFVLDTHLASHRYQDLRRQLV